MIPLKSRGGDTDYLTLEFSLTFPVPGPGRLQCFSSSEASPVVLADCLTTPTSMVLDKKRERVVISEQATGRLVTFELR